MATFHLLPIAMDSVLRMKLMIKNHRADFLYDAFCLDRYLLANSMMVQVESKINQVNQQIARLA